MTFKEVLKMVLQNTPAKSKPETNIPNTKAFTQPLIKLPK